MADDKPGGWLLHATVQAAGEAAYKVLDDPQTRVRLHRQREKAIARIEADIAKAEKHKSDAIARAARQLKTARHWRRRIKALREEVEAIRWRMENS